MPDFAMCPQTQCPMMHTCRRSPTVTAPSVYQAWAEFPSPVDGECAYYKPVATTERQPRGRLKIVASRVKPWTRG